MLGAWLPLLSQVDRATASAALADAAIIATAQAVVQGAANDQLASATGAAAGQVVVQGAAANTLGGAAAVGAGLVVIQGGLTETAGAATSASSGLVVIQGGLSQTLDNAILHGGNSSATGTLAVSLDSVVVTATATSFVPMGRLPFTSLSGVLANVSSLVGAFAHTASVTGALVVTASITGAHVPTSSIVGALQFTTDGDFPMPFTGTHVTIPLTLSYNGTAFDPTSLTLLTVDPAGTKTTYTAGSPAMQHPTTGSYYIELVPTMPGTWKYAWTATKADGRVFHDENVIIVSRRLGE